MPQVVNKHYKGLFVDNSRYVILMGGRGAGRSTTASQFVASKLIAPQYFRCAIMRYVLGDIRNSIYQDICDRLDETGHDKIVKKIENVLTLRHKKNSVQGIGFKRSSGDQKSKLKSLANYNFVVIEEADEVSEEDFIQLDDSLRTVKSNIKIVLLLNPPHKNHWIIKRFFNLIPSKVEGFYKYTLKESCKHNTTFISTTYKQNIHNLNASSIANYLNYKKTRPDHYYNMICGLVSEGARGRIFKNWLPMSDKDFEALPYPSFYGLDFGFSNDPTALIEIKEHNGVIYLREIIFELGLTNQRIAERMRDLGVSRSAPIYADCAEPKSVKEIREQDWNIMSAVKGADSIDAGIDYLLSRQVFYTESSTNIARESQDYRWALDRNKEPTNIPVDDSDHSMDAIRYGVFSHKSQGWTGIM